MMTAMRTRVSRAARLLGRTPSVGVAAIVYSAAIQAASFRADVVDLSNRWWVVTAALILLLSPLVHTFVIHRTFAALRRIPFHLRDLPVESFGSLVAGELLVNAAVVIGSVFFLLPGVYVGMRLIYYKQAIILHKARLAAAVRESLVLTADGRRLLGMFLVLAASYCVPLGIELIALPATDALSVHAVAVLISAAFVAWINVYVTLAFIEDAEAVEGDVSVNP